MIKAITAIAEKGFIGYDNRTIWDYPEDMQHFKRQTEGQLVVMGSKTFESLGCKPLVNRVNIVLSNNKSFQGTIAARHIGKVIDYYHAQEKDLYVIGGAEVYKLFEPFIEAWWITWIKKDFEILQGIDKEKISRFTPDLSRFEVRESFTKKDLLFQYYTMKEG